MISSPLRPTDVTYCWPRWPPAHCRGPPPAAPLGTNVGGGEGGAEGREQLEEQVQDADGDVGGGAGPYTQVQDAEGDVEGGAGEGEGERQGEGEGHRHHGLAAATAVESADRRSRTFGKSPFGGLCKLWASGGQQRHLMRTVWSADVLVALRRAAHAAMPSTGATATAAHGGLAGVREETSEDVSREAVRQRLSLAFCGCARVDLGALDASLEEHAV